MIGIWSRIVIPVLDGVSSAEVAPRALLFARGCSVLLVEPRCCLQPAEHPVPVPALEQESWALCLRKVWGEGPWGWYSSEAPLTDEFALSF